MKYFMKKNKGFTLIELLIVIAIVGVIATMALPTYSTYVNKSKFSEVVAQTAAAKLTVSLCYQEDNIWSKCNGTNLPTDHPGMYNDVPSPGIGYLDNLTIRNGVITAQATADLFSATYILKPTNSGNGLEWAVDPSSTCLTRQICKPR